MNCSPSTERYKYQRGYGRSVPDIVRPTIPPAVAPIRVSPEDRKRLEALKRGRRETFGDVVHRLIVEHDSSGAGASEGASA